jgi:muconolactone delta-isomerase
MPVSSFRRPVAPLYARLTRTLVTTKLTRRAVVNTESANMEFLVSMTTHVPDGTSRETIEDTRAREANRSQELAALGHLLRLWRPPLKPGEWRTLGLFAATGEGHLEKLLRSMPLRIWRTDEATPLLPHPNDPALALRGSRKSPTKTGAPEFLTSLTIAAPQGSTEQAVADTLDREAHRTRQLAEQGQLLRLWALSGEWRTLGLWQARDAAELQSILESLPLYGWMAVATTPLTHHPNDPAAQTT